MKTEDFQKILRHDFSSFIRFAFGVLHPGAPYHHNWHIDAMAHHLALVDKGEIRRLIINMPPRMLKSHCASIAFPAWVLGRDARKSLLYLHGGKQLGLELEDFCTELMKSRRYRSLFPGTIIKEEKGRFRTGFGGRRQHMPIMSRLTGLGADIIVIDDPIGTDEVRDESVRNRLHRQFDENITQRLNNKKSGAVVLVMQRLHEDDLTAHLLAKNQGWVHLNLPAIALEDETWQLPYGRTYRRKKGEALYPARESREELLKTLLSVGGYAFAYQYMQGAYKPQFGETGEGGLWLSGLREGEFWDMYDESRPKRLHGLHRLNELNFMLPRIFNIGEDPIPPNARNSTMEEVLYNAALHREVMLEHQRKVAAGEEEY